MYRVAIIINENEVSHSKYADTLSTLNSALDECNENGKKGNSYHFTILDKFNIHTLFETGENNIKTFDGIFIATNAMSINERIYNVFCENKQSVEEFINDNKGVFISSQKKLSNGSLSKAEYKSTGFLPEIFDYYLFDRPEKYSSDGVVSISTRNKILLYPYKINNEIIKTHCENNQFIVHTYRSLIIPKHSNSYDTLLCDNTSAPISHTKLGYINSERKVLLSCRYNKRIVISTMALDWANHREILCNILTFITQDIPRTIFVKKESERNISTIIDSYIIRANIANLPYRVISENEIDDYTKISGNTLIFSPNWTTEEIEKIYAELLIKQNIYFSIYHICRTYNSSSNSHKLSKYCNFSSIDTMKDVVIQNLLSNYLTTSWNKSVWTYSYILKLIEFFDFDIQFVAKRIYQELTNHFTKKDEETDKLELTGSYDNVFNATCKMLEILNYFQDKYEYVICEDSPYKIGSVIKSADSWILAKIEVGAVFDQDICYCLLYFLKNNRYDSLNNETKAQLMQLLTQLLVTVTEEILSLRIKNRSSVDLCRIYQTLCFLTIYKTFKLEKTATYLEEMESILKERQDIYGNWKNITETAEITAMLLEVYELRSKINISMDTINILIPKGIEMLHSQFNSKANMWSNDLSATAKAMYAIGLYDKNFNFAINDFFWDLKNNQETRIDVIDETKIDRIGNFYKTIDGLEKERDLLSKQIIADEKSILVEKNKSSKARTLSLFLLAALLISLAMFTLLYWILLASYPDTLRAILKDWSTHLIAGFFGFLITVIGMFIYSIFSKKINQQ